jgi:hypothetical protein
MDKLNFIRLWRMLARPRFDFFFVFLILGILGTLGI